MKTIIASLFILLCIGNTLQSESNSFQQSYAPLLTLQLEQTINQSIETAIAPETEYIYNIDQTLQSADEQLQLIAKSYEQNLEAKGDCVILYSDCNFQGASKKYCNQPDEQLSFELPVKSIFVPIGSSFQITDKLEGNKLNLIYSKQCISEGIHIQEQKKQKNQDISWLKDIDQKDLIPLDNEYKKNELIFFDNNGNKISRDQYQQMVETDAQRTYQIMTGQYENNSPQ